METLLTRTVRFSAGADRPRGPNGFAASPPMRGLGGFVELRVECRGEPDQESGYLLNIKAIDDAVHEHARPVVDRALGDGTASVGATLGDVFDSLADALPVTVDRVRLALSPYHAFAMAADDRDHAEIRLQFDFAASHRLHVPGWSDATNREHFGKCNSPNGHGHNYRLEVRVRVPAAGLGAFSVEGLERAVQETVIARFDHKHLNLDTAEFADGSGLNPSVENIAMVCYQLLGEPIAALGEGTTLGSVRVWETDRTSSVYPA